METLTALEKKEVLRDINVLVPVDDGSTAREMVPLAAALRGNGEDSQVNIIGITQVPADASLSEGALL